MGYDNFEGKGDHRHYKGREHPYAFKGLDKMWKDFKGDIRRYREGEP